MKTNDREYLESVWRKVRVVEYENQQQIIKGRKKRSEMKHILKGVGLCTIISLICLLARINFGSPELVLLSLCLMSATSYLDFKFEQKRSE